MRKLAFALLGATVLTAACSHSPNSTQATVAEAVPLEAASNPTPEVVDWDGRWSGVIPCASCPGIEVDLTFKNNGTYRMRTEYQDREGGPFMSEGKLSWDEATRVLTLHAEDEDRDQQILFIGEGEAMYLDLDGKALPLYRLVKQAEYRASGQQLILPLQSIRVDDNKVFFNGLLNFSELRNGGFKSVRGDAVIDCAKQHVSFRDATYYPETDAVGQRITNVSHMVRGGFSLGSNAAESVILQVAETFCPNR